MSATRIAAIFRVVETAHPSCRRRVSELPGDKLLSPAKRSREPFIVRQIVDDRKNSVRTLNMELRFEGFLGKKVSADASHPYGRNLGK